MATRYDVTGAGGLRLAAWDYGTATATGADATAGSGVTASPAAAAADLRAATGAAGTARRPLPGGDPEPRPGMLLLHGLLGRASHWAATARRLSPSYRALALDQRGHGRSGKPAGPYTPEAYVRDALAAVEQLDLGPVTLVGHSMGALTAWQCAVRRPDLVAAVVLCDMRASALGEKGQREWADWLASWPLPFATLGDVRQWFGVDDPRADPPDPVRGDFFAEVMSEHEDGWRPSYAPAHLLRSREPWIRDAHWDELARVRCPALVVRGPGGELGRAEAQEMVRVLPRGRYAEIADAGHLVPWDQPDAWAETLECFVGDALAERAGASPG
ncbi:Pimeloyl-ACP methyl ester carboxylesterase [Actinacidiphila yanglinensis]|uniref:Pimeloyl-ACP methyl ester carboxylesterase n=1 Tax=Actinacidiphila yanglinensis TaxID=310779 RepID=A0A1H5Z9F1_9ACTN|nr:alpha/beta hydrolase [Actinacidiphila yanglinensis]SEG32355.1 Pimeloyl-ACP methyl ester carboxylesterase [Actinacidiphila yanglinensis]